MFGIIGFEQKYYLNIRLDISFHSDKRILKTLSTDLRAVISTALFYATAFFQSQ